jgi:hypothetical protein
VYTPNHCGNLLVIKGKAALLKEFREFARGKGPAWNGVVDEKKDSPLDLHKFVPVPPEVLNAKKNNRSDAFSSGGYEWCCSNWGTKWGVYDIELTELKGALQYQFLTAWAPFNVSVLMAMSERFLELEFELKYAEAGMGFAGIMTASGGEADDQYAENGSRLAKRDEDIEMLMGISG